MVEHLTNHGWLDGITALQTKLDSLQLYTESEVANLAKAFYDPQGKQAGLQAHLAPAVDRFKHRWNEAATKQDKGAKDELEIVRKDLATFVRMYDFLLQIINYGDNELESRNIFFRHLIPLLKTENLSDAINLSKVQLSHYRLKQLGQQIRPCKSKRGTIAKNNSRWAIFKAICSKPSSAASTATKTKPAKFTAAIKPASLFLQFSYDVVYDAALKKGQAQSGDSSVPLL